jgi:hypothetical protein
MDNNRPRALNKNLVPFDSTEFDAGYLARLSGEPQCLGATLGWRAGWADADAGCYSSQLSAYKCIA